ncbi:MAG: heme lyase CcmF/NrfE family subunit [Nitrospirae bacterium]|nr:heme lyase CcmF/NrfE family subunit [Nitrospirota bacterium]
MTDIGYFSVVVALIVSLYAVVLSVIGKKTGRRDLIASGQNGVLAVSGLLTIAAASLLYAFLSHNFQVEYVASYSSRNLPLLYTISAFYAGNNGSLLLWAWFLSLFSSLVVIQNRRQNREIMPYVISVLMITAFFFLSLLVFISNPFQKSLLVPPDGQGLNPLLQNPGMLVHPPTLYLGYVGFTVPFAFAIAALLTGQLGDTWIRSTRRWTLFSWFFLGIGNLLGSWWAYVELGWGGFWMWDPVESASFMPWLVGTAYLHSVMIQEKRGMLKVWNMVLIIITFALSIFGTFLTRSGVLSSVHTFAESPLLGYLFLGFIGVILLFSCVLLLIRLPLLRSRNELDSFLSRESTFLFNNLLLVGATFAVFWGTVFPIISEAVRGVKVTVGPPFFNQVTIPIFLALLLITGICPLIAWRRASRRNLTKNFLYPFVTGLVGGGLLFVLGIRNTTALISFTLSIFVTATILLEFIRGTKARREMTGEGGIKAFLSLVWKNKRRYGGYIVHLGIIFIFVGVTGSVFKVEKVATLVKGESLTIKDYTLRYNGLSRYPTQNRYVIAATLSVYKEGKKIGILTPRKNFYEGQDQPTTEVAVRSTLKEDLFVILAGYEGEKATFKAIINPLMVWMWIGGYVLSLGGVIILWPDRKRIQKTEDRGQRKSGI